MCALTETRRIVTFSAYADNYATSFQEAKTYQDVKKDMLEVHDRIGLPLKNVWTGVNTDKDIIHQVEKTEKGELQYHFLDTNWNLFNNKTSPVPNLSMGQRIRGEAQVVKLDDIPEQYFNDLLMRGIKM